MDNTVIQIGDALFLWNWPDQKKRFVIREEIETLCVIVGI